MHKSVNLYDTMTLCILHYMYMTQYVMWCLAKLQAKQTKAQSIKSQIIIDLFKTYLAKMKANIYKTRLF